MIEATQENTAYGRIMQLMVTHRQLFLAEHVACELHMPVENLVALRQERTVASELAFRLKKMFPDISLDWIYNGRGNYYVNESLADLIRDYGFRKIPTPTYYGRLEKPSFAYFPESVIGDAQLCLVRHKHIKGDEIPIGSLFFAKPSGELYHRMTYIICDRQLHYIGQTVPGKDQEHLEILLDKEGKRRKKMCIRNILHLFQIVSILRYYGPRH